MVNVEDDNCLSMYSSKDKQFSELEGDEQRSGECNQSDSYWMSARANQSDRDAVQA